ncbi:YheC/YheD family protein [Salinicoccus roseus]|uniref:YheC/YheD family protein n=1 Tax=Salinicoccus roseus TaxID=45670 RepID=UPI003524DAF4
MLVGMMGAFRNPSELAKITSLICTNYGIELVYLRPNDINIETGTATGKLFLDNEWVEKETEIPKFIDINPYNFKKRNREVTKYLKNKVFLSDNRSKPLSKRAFQEALENDPKYKDFVIPTYDVKSYEDIKTHPATYPKFVLKPAGGIQGKGVYIVEKIDDKYKVGHYTEENHFTEDEMKDFYYENIDGKKFILQKYVTSKTLQGDPFDCRIHLEKNGEGKWQIAKKYIRIGIGQKVISNTNQGGGIADVKQFLEANYGTEWTAINKKLDDLAAIIPYKIEKLRDTHIMSLGIDVGIDRDGKLYIFEANDRPATKPMVSEVAYLRSNYYRYVFEHILGIQEDATETEDEEYTALVNERDMYKREYDKIKSSTSWRISAPVRKLGELKSKFNKGR